MALARRAAAPLAFWWRLQGVINKVTRASEKNTDVNSRGTCYFCHLYRGGTSLVRFDRAAIICRDIVLGIG